MNESRLDTVLGAFLVVLLSALCSLTTGCGSQSAGPGKSYEPWFGDLNGKGRAYVQTSPPGATVYVLDDSGTSLGPALGTAPVEIEYSYYRTMSGALGTGRNVNVTSPASCIKPRFDAQANGFRLILRCAATKPGFRTTSAEREIGFVQYSGAGGPDLSTPATMTIVLGTEEVTAPMPTGGLAPPSHQQQQQQQQQTVVIPGAGGQGGPQTGNVILSASADGAEIYVDGLFVGNAPANLKLTDGIHVIEVKKDGYEPYKRELRVLAGGEVSLRAELKKQ